MNFHVLASLAQAGLLPIVRGRDRSKTKPGARHVVNPPGTKIARKASERRLTLKG